MVNTIGKEEELVRRYVEAMISLSSLDDEKRDCFLSKANINPIQIQMILGLNVQESLLTTVRAPKVEPYLPLGCWSRISWPALEGPSPTGSRHCHHCRRHH